MTNRVALLLSVVLLAACSTSQPIRENIPELTEAPSFAMERARQIVMITTPSWDSSRGELHRFENHGSGWKEVGNGYTVSLGRNGVAWGLGMHPMPQPGPEKEEGDGRSPAGVFGLSHAFGYAEQISTLLPYQPMGAGHYCVDDADSPLYTRIVDTREVGKSAVRGSTEPMRRDIHKHGDGRYALGIKVEHNQQAEPGKGSCIFIHLWQEPLESTAGCTAMDEERMRELLEWLDPERQPVLVLLPESEYNRMKQVWKLPKVALIQ